jgi:hypothetical protein
MQAHDAPDHFACPISLDVMDDPVSAADGHSYERAAIERWIEQESREDAAVNSPKTGARLDHLHLTPNHALRSAIADWRERQQETAWTVPPHRVEIGEEIGRGSFGVVTKGRLQEISGKWIDVALKSMPALLPEQARTHLDRELNVLSRASLRCSAGCSHIHM